MNTNREESTGPENTLDEKFHRLVRKREAAAFLAVTTRTVEKMVRDKRIPAIWIGRTIRFRLSDILDHLRNP